jgi:hypothetical protein
MDRPGPRPPGTESNVNLVTLALGILLFALLFFATAPKSWDSGQ